MPSLIWYLIIVSVFFVVLTFLFRCRIWHRDYYAQGTKARINWDEGAWVPLTISIILFVIAFSLMAHWQVRSVKADIINRKLGTDYTHEELFWGGQVIQDITEGELERKRIEGEIKVNLHNDFFDGE